MNVLYYLGNFPKLSESFILNELYVLNQRGDNVAVFAQHDPGSEIQHKELNDIDIPIRYLDHPSYTDFPHLFSPTVIKATPLEWISYDAPFKRRLSNVLRAKQCIEFVESLPWEVDHVHTHFASLGKFAAQHTAAYFDTTFTVTTHAYDLYKKPVGAYTRDLLSRADQVVTISEYNARHIETELHVKTPIDVIRAGIRPEKFEPTDSTIPNRLLTVGRFVEKKGLTYALEAVARASEEIETLDYHIIGSGPLEGKLEDRVTQLGIEDHVSFLDNVSDERLVSEFDEAQGFLLPCVIDDLGNRDGIPVVLMEAMAMQTPPISTKVSGIPELVENEQNGLLTEPKDPGATAEAIVRLLRNDYERETYAENAREKVCRDFNIKTETEKLESVFERAGSNDGN